jgi:hypothetical protein
MENVNNLLEGASPYQVLQNESAKLAGKWGKSGLLEGIESSTEKNNMSMLLENQAKQLVNEASTTGTGASFNAGNSEAWAGVALPLVRRVFGEIVAKDLVSVQPMNLPAGLIFYLDFQYGTANGGKTLGESLYGASDDLRRTEIDSTTGKPNEGLYGAGEFGYSAKQVQGFFDGGITSASATFGGILQGDTEFSASYAGLFGSTAEDTVNVIQIPTASLTGSSANETMDLEGIRSFRLTAGTHDSDQVEKFFPQFTRINGGNVEFVVSGAAAVSGDGKAFVTCSFSVGPDNLNDRGDFEDSTAAASGAVSTLAIPEINVQLKSDTVAAKTRKLKAQWTPEFAQDLNAYHSIDAEAELTSILSEYISMEIDLEILDMLIRNADTIEGWSAKVAQDVSVSSNTTTGGTAAVTHTSTQNNLGVYYTKMSWFQTLGVKLQKVSNLIHQKTLRGGANFMVVSPKVSTILESIPGFAADSAGDADKYAMGVQKIGAINSRYTVYKNPYMTENTILMGYKGSQFLETGAVFAPYIPLIMTPLVYDPASFTPRKGIMTRYAKKMVRPDFYGKVMIHDLNEL